MPQPHDLAIVGSGPAAYTAAIYAARAGRAPLLFEGEADQGGALMTTTEIENFPGFPDGITGPQLMQRLRNQALRFGAVARPDDVVEVDLAGRVKLVSTGAGEIVRTRTVIVATGSAYKRLHIVGEDELSGQGVSWCATCDGAFYRDRTVVVVGGGDSAMEEATFLTRFAREVTVVHRGETLRASRIMQDRALGNEKISFRWNSQLTEIEGDHGVTGVVLRDRLTGDLDRLACDGVFVAIGPPAPRTLVADQLELDAKGYVMVDRPSMRTRLPGVFACGDLVDATYRQAITAASSGCVAALDAEEYLSA